MIHLTRYRMYRRISEFFRTERKGKVLCVSGTGFIAGLFHPDSEITDARYPAVDIHSLPYPDNSFDFFLADQVIEHVRHPFIAAEEIFRVLKTGGWAIVTTCLMNPVHKEPEDFWRFTPDGLKILFEKFSEVFQCEGWGNGQAVDLMINKNLRFEPVIPGTPLEKIALDNDGENLIVTWIIARK